LGKNKKKKNGFFKRTRKVASKQFEVDKVKSNEKKRLKKAKPKGYGARRAGAITFWVIFSFMFLVIFVTLLTGSDNEAAENIETANESKITSQESVEFAKSFLHEYFNVDVNTDAGDDSELISRTSLSKYLANNVVDAHIDLGNGKVSTLNRNEIITKDVTKIDDQNARITFLVNLVVKRPLTEDELKEVEKLKKDGKDINELLGDEEDKDIKSEIKGKEEIQYISMYVSVPVHLKDNDKGFIISELPSFTYIDETNDDNKIKSKYSELEEVKDSNVEENIQAFLQTFFESYSQDSKDKLSYILLDEDYEYGLNKTLNFEDISDVKIYRGKSGKEFIVDVNVNFIEPNTEMKMTSNYMLVIAEEGTRYVVKHINNDNYIEDVLKQKDAGEDDADSENQDNEEFDEDEIENEGNDVDEEIDENEIEEEIEEEIEDETEEVIEENEEDDVDEEEDKEDKKDKKDKGEDNKKNTKSNKA